jgi:hypothetical protein
MACQIAKQLLAEYFKCASELLGAADTLANLAGSKKHKQFADAKRRAKKIRTDSRAARLALEKHLAEHNCAAFAAAP